MRIRSRKFGIIINNEWGKPMNNEPNKPIPAQELTEKELEGVNGGAFSPAEIRFANFPIGKQFDFIISDFID